MRTGSIADTLKVDVAPASVERIRVSARAQIFDAMYANAEGDPARVPWTDGRPCPLLVHWLNHEAPRMVRPGSRSIVIGCGLGDDVAELVQRGYDVLGFDCSPVAVRWAARRNPSCADRFMVADLLDVPARLASRFDLVVENATLPQIEPEQRAAAMAGVARLLSPRGVAVVICRSRPREEPFHREDGPPWPLTDEELLRLAVAAGMSARRVPEEFPDEDHPPLTMMLGVFSKA